MKLVYLTFIMEVGKPTLYRCGVCEYHWFTKRMYTRHKSLYHRGLPMIEQTVLSEIYTYIDWILNFTLPCGHKPVIYTCVICRLNYLKLKEYNDHNSTKHSSLMNGGMKFSRIEHASHFSVSSREKRDTNDTTRHILIHAG